MQVVGIVGIDGPDEYGRAGGGRRRREGPRLRQRRRRRQPAQAGQPVGGDEAAAGHGVRRLVQFALEACPAQKRQGGGIVAQDGGLQALQVEPVIGQVEKRLQQARAAALPLAVRVDHERQPAGVLHSRPLHGRKQPEPEYGLLSREDQPMGPRRWFVEKAPHLLDFHAWQGKQGARHRRVAPKGMQTCCIHHAQRANFGRVHAHVARQRRACKNKRCVAGRTVRRQARHCVFRLPAPAAKGIAAAGPFYLKAMPCIQPHRRFILGEDVELHALQVEPIVGQRQQRAQQQAADPGAPVVRMDHQEDGSGLPLAWMGADGQARRANDALAPDRHQAMMIA